MRPEKNGQQPQNLYELKPLRRLQWETREEDRVVLLVPKFHNRFLVRHLVPLLSKPNFRVRLDAIGSYVWRQCDGETTVLEIARRARALFGGEEEAMNNRVATFIQRLLRDQFVLIQ